MRNRSKNRQVFTFEQLEHRHLMAAIVPSIDLTTPVSQFVSQVMDTHSMHDSANADANMISAMQMHHHSIPDFSLGATHVIRENGNWSEIAQLRTVTADSIVVIEEGYHVVFDSSNVRVKAIGLYGHLQFASHLNTSITLQELLVHGSGYLEIGTASNPIQSTASATITIGDRPLDLIKDPTQAGNGIIVLGKIRVYGHELQETFVNLTKSPKAADTVLQVSNVPTGWQVGDTISLPQTMVNDSQPLTEEFTITALSSTTISLNKAVGFDRPPAIDGDLVTVTKGFNGQELRGHIANLTRNVIFRSENPSGNRGHFMNVGNANVDIRYASFEGLGRTKEGPLDNTTFDAAGNVTDIGTNQIGRYSLHFHHVTGPRDGIGNDASVDPAGLERRQFRAIGNTITDGEKWGITVHASHYGLVSDNVVHDVFGAGIITEDGSESFNYIANNFSFGSQGTGDTGRFDEFGDRGAGFWMRSGHNYWVDNVSAAVEEGYGFYISNSFDTTPGTNANAIVKIPNFPGANLQVSGEYTEAAIRDFPLLKFENNETYSAKQLGVGSWIYDLFKIKNTTIWNSTGTAVLADYQLVDIDGLIIRGHSSNPTVNAFKGHNGTFDIKNFDIQQVKYVLHEDERPNGAVFANGYLRNYDGLRISPQAQGGKDRKYSLRNVRYDNIPGKPLVVIRTAFETTYGQVPQFRPIQIYVFQNQGDPNDNFQLYFNEQAANYIIKEKYDGIFDIIQTRPLTKFVTDAGEASIQMQETYVVGQTIGQTNLEAYNTYRAPILKELAPVNAVKKDGFIGVVRYLPNEETEIPPVKLSEAPSFWFKSNSLSGHSENVDIIYKDFVNTGATSILFKVDDGSWISDADNDGKITLTGLAKGSRKITAALAGPSGNPWGTQVRWIIDVLADPIIKPTFDPIVTKTKIPINAGRQTINITGIKAGVSQLSTITVLSANGALITNASLEYTHGDTEAKYNFTPVKDAVGRFSLHFRVFNAGVDGVYFSSDDGYSDTQIIDFEITDDSIADSKVYFDPLVDVSMRADAGEKVVAISGITLVDANKPAKVTAFSSDPNVIDGLSISYVAGQPTASIKFSPKIAGNSTVTVTLENDGIVVTRTFNVKVNKIPDGDPTVAFNPIIAPTKIQIDSGETQFLITGIKTGLSPTSSLGFITSGSGATKISVDYQHGDSQAVVKILTPQGFKDSFLVEFWLHATGPDGVYFSADDLTYKEAVIFEMVSFAVEVNLVEFDVISDASILVDAGEQFVTLTGINPGRIENGVRFNVTSTNTNAISQASVDYVPGQSTATLRYTPIGNAGQVELIVTLSNAGSNQIFGDLDDVAATQIFRVAVNDLPVVDTQVTFAPIVTKTKIAMNSGETQFLITGIKTGLSPTSSLGYITSGSGLTKISVDYQHGDSQAVVKFSTLQDFESSFLVEFWLHATGPDGVYFSSDDLTHKEAVIFEIVNEGITGMIADGVRTAGDLTVPIATSQSSIHVLPGADSAESKETTNEEDTSAFSISLNYDVHDRAFGSLDDIWF